MALEDGACHRERGQTGGIISSSGGSTHAGQVGKFVCVGCHKRSWEGMTVWLYDWKRGWQEYVLHHFFFRSPTLIIMTHQRVSKCPRTALAANAARQLAQQISWAFVRSPTEDSGENGRRVKILDWTDWTMSSNPTGFRWTIQKPLVMNPVTVDILMSFPSILI